MKNQYIELGTTLIYLTIREGNNTEYTRIKQTLSHEN